MLKAEGPKGSESGYSCSGLITGAGTANDPGIELLQSEMDHAVLLQNWSSCEVQPLTLNFHP